MTVARNPDPTLARSNPYNQGFDPLQKVSIGTFTINGQKMHASIVFFDPHTHEAISIPRGYSVLPVTFDQQKLSDLVHGYMAASFGNNPIPRDKPIYIDELGIHQYSADTSEYQRRSHMYTPLSPTVPTLSPYLANCKTLEDILNQMKIIQRTVDLQKLATEVRGYKPGIIPSAKGLVHRAVARPLYRKAANTMKATTAAGVRAISATTAAGKGVLSKGYQGLAYALGKTKSALSWPWSKPQP